MEVKPFFSDIKEYDYFEPINRLKKNNTYLEKVNLIDNKDKILQSNEDNDVVIHNYIKSTNNCRIIISFKKKLDIYYYYLKELKYNKKVLENIFFQLYIDELKNEDELDDKINSNEDNTLFIYVVNESIIKNYSTNKDIYVCDNLTKTFDVAGMLLHPGSIHFMEKQNCRPIFYFKGLTKIKLLKTFFSNYTLNEKEKSLILNSAVLFSYGVRDMNDIDMSIMKNDIPQSVLDAFEKEHDIDIVTQGTDSYEELWKKDISQIATLCGLENDGGLYDLVYHPGYYYYFCGFKFLRFKCEILNRMRRGNPAQITDLLVIKETFNLPLKLKIPQRKKIWNDELRNYQIVPIDEKTALSTIKYYLEKRYNMIKSVDEVRALF